MTSRIESNKEHTVLTLDLGPSSSPPDFRQLDPDTLTRSKPGTPHLKVRPARHAVPKCATTPRRCRADAEDKALETRPDAV